MTTARYVSSKRGCRVRREHSVNSVEENFIKPLKITCTVGIVLNLKYVKKNQIQYQFNVLESDVDSTFMGHQMPAGIALTLRLHVSFYFRQL